MPKSNPPYSAAFRAEAVELLRTSGKSIPLLAQELGIAEQSLHGWIKRVEIDAGRGAPGELTSAERLELQRLRREVKTLQMEREILKKALCLRPDMQEDENRWHHGGVVGASEICRRSAPSSPRKKLIRARPGYARLSPLATASTRRNFV